MQIIFIVVVVNHHIQVARYVFDNWSRSGVEDTMFEAKDWKKKSGAKTKDQLFKYRPSRGQGQNCSRPKPRTKDKILKKAMVGKLWLFLSAKV